MHVPPCVVYSVSPPDLFSKFITEVPPVLFGRFRRYAPYPPDETVAQELEPIANTPDLNVAGPEGTSRIMRERTAQGFSNRFCLFFRSCEHERVVGIRYSRVFFRQLSQTGRQAYLRDHIRGPRSRRYSLLAPSQQADRPGLC